jgi:hypothetical protein
MHRFLGCLDEEKNKYKDFAGFGGKPRKPLRMGRIPGTIYHAIYCNNYNSNKYRFSYNFIVLI